MLVRSIGVDPQISKRRRPALASRKRVDWTKNARQRLLHPVPANQARRCRVSAHLDVLVIEAIDDLEVLIVARTDVHPGKCCIQRLLSRSARHRPAPAAVNAIAETIAAGSLLA